jgi:hypothetical protein
MKTWVRRFIQIAIFLLVGLNLVVVATQAQDFRPPHLRVINASLGAQSVDIYVDDTLYFQDVAYSYISDYVPVDQGEHSLRVRPAGIKDGADLVTGTANFGLNEGNIGKDYTMVLLETEIQVFEDDNISVFSPGKTRVRMIDVAQEPSLEICINKDQCRILTYKDVSDYIELEAGTYHLKMRLIGTDELYVDVVPLTFESGEVYSIFILDPKQGEVRPRIIPHIDTRKSQPYFPGPGHPPLYPPVTGAFLSPTALLILVVGSTIFIGGSFWVARRYFIHRAR